MSSHPPADRQPAFAGGVDSPHAWWRLAVSLIIGTTGGVGLWSAVVILPETQAHFGIDRGTASLPYTATMIGIMVGNVITGRLVDRFGIIVPILISSISLGLGYAGSAFAPNLWVYLFFQGVMIGTFGSSATFGPLIASISLWFRRHRGIAVALVASGNYVAGAVWPPLVNGLMQTVGWQGTHLVIGAICLAVMMPCAFALRRPPPPEAMQPDPVAARRPGEARIQPQLLQGLLVVAGLACCVAMAMPQVHIVAYCVDLDLGAERGATALSLMLGLGVVSRIAFGLVMDRIGALQTLLIGSALQALSLLLYLPADAVWSLYAVSAVFGLFQGGIVPAYAVIIRENFPASEVGLRVGLVLSATIGGMALGGWMSGVMYDWTLSYEAAFLNGFAWNLINLAIVVTLLWQTRAGVRRMLRPRPVLVSAPLVGRWPGPL